MKHFNFSLVLCVALFLVSATGASAAMAPQSRLVSMQTDGSEVNYQPITFAADKPQEGFFPPSDGTPPTAVAPAGEPLLWLPLNEIMLALSMAVIAVAALFLLYIIIVSFADRYRKHSVRIHSHSTLMHRHIMPKHR